MILLCNYVWTRQGSRPEIRLYISHTTLDDRRFATRKVMLRLKTRMPIPSQTRAFRARLPVPALRHTLNRYLDSLEPFLHEDEQRGGMSFSSAYALRQKWADEFESGIGGTLQERLLGLFT